MVLTILLFVLIGNTTFMTLAMMDVADTFGHPKAYGVVAAFLVTAGSAAFGALVYFIISNVGALS